MRLHSLIAAFFVASMARGQEITPLELEHAVYLETTAGEVGKAEQIYKQLTRPGSPPYRARAEATFRLADLYSRQANNVDAKNLFLQLLRDFPEATDLIPLAELELTKVTAFLTRDQIGTNVASMQHLGDLAISLLGALENQEAERASELMTRLTSTLEGLATGADAPPVLVQLNSSASEINSTLHAERGGGMAAALTQLTKSKDFESFLQRGFPSDPHDVFAPAWRMKDRLARAVASNNADRAEEIALDLQRYLAPLITLPTGQREGTLARITTFAAGDAMQLAKEGKFAEARKRLDEFDTERHEQFGDFRLIGLSIPVRMPEMSVAAAWVVIHRSEQARRELSQRGYATAMDHVTEAVAVCRDMQGRVENKEAAALFKRQQGALEAALWEIKNDRLGAAQQALKRVTEKTK